MSAAATAKTAYGDLQRCGFTVIRGFLTPAELTWFRADYERQPVEKNANYQLTALSDAANAMLRQRVVDVLTAVRAATDLKVDLPTSGNYFATGRKRGIYFPWHQDHESFFETQNHYDYLNFYIPIVKPRADKSNLSIVPFDVLQRESPSTYRSTVRGGATRFDRIGRWHVALHDDRCTVHVMRDGLDRIAHTPLLQAGDLLLMRGDVIHRTQDADTERVAVSFRAACAGTVVRRSRLVRGGFMKARMMANHPRLYQRMFAAFDVSGRQEMPFRELTERLHTVVLAVEKDRRQFWRYLLVEKLRAGAMPQLIASILSLKVVDVVDHCMEAYIGLRRRARSMSARTAEARR